jgi:rhodanese-related sulfurtransferase
MTNSLNAMDFFSAKLTYEIAPEDLDLAQSAGVGPLVVDTRTAAAWEHSHIPGAIHLPVEEIGVRASADLPDEDAEIVVYSWGPGSAGAARAALVLYKLGYTNVRELSGGFESWECQGLAIESHDTVAASLSA